MVHGLRFGTFARRTDLRKGFVEFEAALNHLQTLTSKDVSATILSGDPKSESYQELEDKLHTFSPIQKVYERQEKLRRVLLPGHPPHIVGWYLRSGCGVHAASYEPFGLTALEAVASGCAILSTRMGASQLLMHREKTVFVGSAERLSTYFDHTRDDDDLLILEPEKILPFNTETEAWLRQMLRDRAFVVADPLHTSAFARAMLLYSDYPKLMQTIGRQGRKVLQEKLNARWQDVADGFLTQLQQNEIEQAEHNGR